MTMLRTSDQNAVRWHGSVFLATVLRLMPTLSVLILIVATDAVADRQPLGKIEVSDALLHQAAATGDVETMRFLLECGSKVDARSKLDHATPLHAAATAGDVEIARLLIAGGADVSRREVP